MFGHRAYKAKGRYGRVRNKASPRLTHYPPLQAKMSRHTIPTEFGEKNRLATVCVSRRPQTMFCINSVLLSQPRSQGLSSLPPSVVGRTWSPQSFSHQPNKVLCHPSHPTDFFATQILGGHVTSRNQGLSSREAEKRDPRNEVASPCDPATLPEWRTKGLWGCFSLRHLLSLMCQPEVYWLLKQCMLLFSGWQIWISKEMWRQCL